MGDIERERIIDQLRRCLADKEDVLLGYLYGSFLCRDEFRQLPHPKGWGLQPGPLAGHRAAI